MGVWRKIGGVFLEFEDEQATTPKRSSRTAPSSAAPSDLAGDADALLAQLEGRAPSRPRRARTSAPPSRAAAPAASSATPAPPPPKADPLTMSPEAVYEAAGISDNPNSADRILKMIAGLAAFPPEQQRAMVQALDAADPSWAEADVLTDARSRQAALRNHLRSIEAEGKARAAALSARQAEVEKTGKTNLDEIDKQIAELQSLRQQQVASTASQVQKLTAEAAELEAASETARRGVTDEVNRLSGLMTFFTGART